MAISTSRKSADFSEYGGIVNDSSAAARAANDAALAIARADNYHIHFPCVTEGAVSTYHFDTFITMKQRERWTGDGRQQVTLNFHGALTTEAIITLNERTSINDLTINSQSGLGYGIKFDDTDGGGDRSRCTFQNVDVTGCEVGWRLNNGWINQFINCWAGTCSIAGVQFTGGTFQANNNCSWIGGEIRGCPIGFDLIAQTKGFIIRDVAIESCSNYGIQVSGNNIKEGLVVKNCYFEFNTNGHIYVTGRTMGMQVLENFFACTSSVMHSLEVDSTAESRPIDAILVKGNSIRNQVGPTSDFVFNGSDVTNVKLIDGGGTKVYNANLPSIRAVAEFTSSATGAGPVANVLDYGAINDGTTDNSTAIQSAIDTGLPVYLPGGASSYGIGSTLNMNNGSQTLYGDGKSSRLLCLSGCTLAIAVQGVAENTIRDIQIGGNSEARIGIHVQANSLRTTIKDVEIQDLASATNNVEGILLNEGSHHSLIQGCDIHDLVNTNSPTPDAVRGIRISGVATGIYGVRVIGNTIDNLSPRQDADGIVVQSFTTDPDIVISQNTIRHCAKRAIKLQNGGCVVTGNRCDLPNVGGGLDPATAILVQGGNTVVSGNVITAADGFADACILVNTTNGGIAITNNIIDVTAGHGLASCDGIQFSAATPGTTISGNVFGEDIVNGVRFDGAATETRITGNHFNGISGDIVRMTVAGVTGVVVTGNTWESLTGNLIDDAGNGASGIYVEGNLGDGTGGNLLANVSGDVMQGMNRENIFDGGNTGASQDIHWKADGLTQKYTVNATTTLTFTAPAGATWLTLLLDNTGAFDVTLPTLLGDTVAVPHNEKTVIRMFYDGTDYHV